MNANQDALGRSIRTIRQAMGWNASRLAHAMKVSQPYLSQLEAGLRPLNARRADQMERITGVNPYVHAWLRSEGFGLDSETIALRLRLANKLEEIAKGYGEAGI